MSVCHWRWDATGLHESAITLVFRLVNSGMMVVKYANSVVQTGVKSAGCEQKHTHSSPAHSAKDKEAGR